MRTPDRELTTMGIPRRRGGRTAGGWAAAVACAVLLSGCATPGARPGPDADGDPSPSATIPAYDVEPGQTLRCGGLSFSSDALVKPVPLSRADERVREAVESAADDAGMPVAAAEAPETWLVASADDRQIALLHPRADAEGSAPAFEQVTLLWHEAGSDRPAEWTVASSGPCAPRADAGELNAAAIALDPEQPPAPSDTTVHLLVTELACHGGEDAEGRVELASLIETDESVEIVIGVRPDETADAWTCQSNPATPFALELDAPLGDRDIVDVGVVPAQTLEPVDTAG